jgi:predicted patatin/cPLA2 family phospholipase
MRGVVSGAMLAGLEQLDALDGFDVVYGASAGAVGGAYFLARQALYGMEIYHHHLTGSDFRDYRRAARGEPLLSIDYLLEKLMRGDKPLRVDRVLENDVEFRVAVSSVDDNRCELLGPFRDGERLYRALRAAISLPLVTGDPVEIDGREYMDAAMTQPIPFFAAIEDGCTHVLNLLSRPQGEYRPAPGFWHRVTFGRALMSLSEGLADLYRDREALYRAGMDELARSSEAPDDEPYLYGLSVDTDREPVGSFETDTDRLLEGARMGYTAAVELLTEGPVETVVTLRALDDDGRVVEPPGRRPTSRPEAAE